MARRSASPLDSQTTTMPVHLEEFGRESEMTTALGTGEFADESVLDPLAGSAATKKLPAGVIVIIGVVVCAIAGLFFMKFVSSASAKNIITGDIAKRVDDFILVLDKAANLDPKNSSKSGQNRHSNHPLSLLNEDISERITPIDHLPRRDPFRLVVDETKAAASTTVVSIGDSEEVVLAKRREAKRIELERAGSEFKLKMIMGGNKPLANLNGTIVGVGQVIPSPKGSAEFKVKSIDADRAILEARDEATGAVAEVVVVLERNL